MESVTDTANRVEDRDAAERFLQDADEAVRKAIECGKEKVTIHIPHVRFGLENYNDEVVASTVYAALQQLGYDARMYGCDIEFGWKPPASPAPAKRRWWQ